MKKDRVTYLIYLLLAVVVVSCSGKSGAKNSAATVTKETVQPEMPARRLIEVLSPADNSNHSCADKLTFSVTAVAGAGKPDSVQLWVGSGKITTLLSLPSNVEVPATGKPGRVSFRAVAFSTGSKPQTISLSVNLLSSVTPSLYRYRVVNRFPHDSKAYTQGLVYDDAVFYEGTGKEGESSLRRVEPETGKVLSQVNLDEALFGEGVALLGERIYQLTWTSKVGFVYDKASLKQVNRIYYLTQGWGLTTMGDTLVMSDGTNVIWFLDADFNVISSLEVWDNKGPVDNLNELEMIDGELWANIWQTDRIARIDIRTGCVTSYVDLSNLLPRNDRRPETDVLNGIAWDASGRRLFVTGKYWPALFQIVPVAVPGNRE